ncbi:hypothetical protein [Teichococcus vastitatis]|uniref:Uncharacterized protein n=1 Tax=Teichococcus vastitatis TaxID=2307076 RepID=A0ABS9WBS8_9PROT|nr:hypothetical protein [Pseudoroseomonas vastitatis]MCI0756673.1 hypothetical protein [Pseudoroseomonas vastitatis]
MSEIRSFLVKLVEVTDEKYQDRAQEILNRFDKFGAEGLYLGPNLKLWAARALKFNPKLKKVAVPQWFKDYVNSDDSDTDNERFGSTVQTNIPNQCFGGVVTRTPTTPAIVRNMPEPILLPSAKRLLAETTKNATPDEIAQAFATMEDEDPSVDDLVLNPQMVELVRCLVQVEMRKMLTAMASLPPHNS